MTKYEFKELSDDTKRYLVGDALSNLIIFEKEASSLCSKLIRPCNLEVMKIVLGAYMNGEIK